MHTFTFITVSTLDENVIPAAFEDSQRAIRFALRHNYAGVKYHTVSLEAPDWPVVYFVLEKKSECNTEFLGLFGTYDEADQVAKGDENRIVKQITVVDKYG